MSFAVLIAVLASSVVPAGVDDAVVQIGDCSGVCVDQAGLVLTAKHCDLPPVAVVHFRDRIVTALRIYVSADVEGPVVFDCDGDGFPFTALASALPMKGTKVWSCGYPRVGNSRQLRCTSGPLLGSSTFEFRGQSFRGTIAGFSTAPGWSGGPLLNARGEVCGLLSGSSCATSVFITLTAVREAYSLSQNQRATKPTLYVFGSAQCGRCLAFKRDYTSIASLKQQLTSQFTVVFVDVDAYSDVAQQLGITEIPAFVVYGQPAVTGYEGPEQLIAALRLRDQITAQPPTRDEVEAEEESQPDTAAPSPPADAATNAPSAAEQTVTSPTTPSAVDVQLDRLSGLVHTAVSIATWLGVGGITGGTAGLILGGVSLLRTLRRRHEIRPARDPPQSRPPVVTIDSPPPPQAIVPETRFAPYERDTFAEAFAWAEAEMARKYPGVVSTLEAMKGLIDQFLSAKGVKPTK